MYHLLIDFAMNKDKNLY